MQAEEPDYMELYEIQKKTMFHVSGRLYRGLGSQVESIHDGTLKSNCAGTLLPSLN